MKSLITTLLVIGSFSVFAKSLSKLEQRKIVSDITKKVRKEYYVEGHEAVSTDSPLLMNKKDLIEFYLNYKNEQFPGEELTEKETSSLFKCHYSKSCALWFFGSSSEFMGGFGTREHFILLNKSNGDYKHISYASYAE